MPWTIWIGVFLFVLSGSLCTVSCGGTDVNGTCSAKTAVEGKTGGIELYFNGIDFSADQFFIVLQKDHKDILHCGHVAAKAITTCMILNNDFKYDGKVHANMTVIIPNVTNDLGGTFELHTIVNEVSQDPTSCDLTVVQQLDNMQPNITMRVSQPDTQVEEDPGIVVVVAPTVLAIIVVIVIIVFVVRYHRRDNPESPQEEHMISLT